MLLILLLKKNKFIFIFKIKIELYMLKIYSNNNFVFNRQNYHNLFSYFIHLFIKIKIINKKLIKIKFEYEMRYIFR